MLTDTIAAISTSLQEQAISVIRISGDEALEIASRLTHKDFHQIATHTVTYTFIRDPLSDEIIDEVLITVMKSPRSYTKEDIVEISCHGGVYITQKVLSAVLSHGVRMAEPGEFTRRALINGRIDLTQAEAVQDMIEADSPQSAALAISGIRGSLQKLIQPMLDELMNIIAQIEVNIDYPEYDDVEQLTRSAVLPLCLSWSEKLEVILQDARSGRQMKEGVKTVIVGKPNVGKSSLLNALLEEDKAIVTDIAGTTRDLVEGSIRLKNVTLHLIDTAGIRESHDVIEQIGIQKTKKALLEAELILLILDASTVLDAYDTELMEMTDASKRIIVYNKTDLYPIEGGIGISAMQNEIGALVDAINKRFEPHQRVFKTPALNNERTIAQATKAALAMKSAVNALNQGMEMDLVTIDLQECYMDLGEILHSVSREDIIDTLFSRFCLGK